MSQYIPCQKEKEEERQALEEWVSADNERQAFFSTKPLDPHEDVERQKIEKERQMDQAEDKAAKAKEKYLAAKKAREDCEETYG